MTLCSVQHNMKNGTLMIFFALLMLFPAAAQSHDLSGIWVFTDKHDTDIRIELSSVGNSWAGDSLSKLRAELKLNPAGLRNQWVGTLILDDTHSVKADLKSGKLVVKDLDDGESWTFSRSD
jgi:hypothetical protein